MRLEASLQARQEMRLKLAPQIIQSIEILQLPLLELRERIDQELMENPLLEVAPASTEEDTAQVTGEETVEEPASNAEDREADEVEADAEEADAVEPIRQDPEAEPDTDPMRDQNYEALEDLIRPGDYEGYGGEWHGTGGSGERDAKLAALENSPAPDISLEEHLRQQLAYYDLSPTTRQICVHLIANLDWRGYLVHPLDEIIASMETPVTLEQAEEALRAVQRLDPPGVGARTIEECLLLQLDERVEANRLLRTLISEHFADIARNRYPKVAKAVGCTVEELKDAIEQIAKLNPIPGALFAEAPAPHVIPDLQVELVEGEYRVMLEDTSLPSLRICSYYARRLQQKDLDPKTRITCARSSRAPAGSSTPFSSGAAPSSTSPAPWWRPRRTSSRRARCTCGR